MMTRVTYLSHSGFFLEWEHCCWLFDYYRGEIPAVLPGKKLFIFCSHSHGDHFNPQVFDMSLLCSKTEFVFSNELKSACRRERKKRGEEGFPEITFVPAWSDVELDDRAGQKIHLHALRSTDCGAGFFLEYEGKTVYHAGDLHWWTWPGEPEAENRQMMGDYKKEIKYLEARQIDLAFNPLDPRQDEDYDKGMDYLLEHACVRHAFPMHFWGDYSVITRYLSREKRIPRATKIMRIQREGQVWDLE